MPMRNRLVQDYASFARRKDSLWTICRPPEDAAQLYTYTYTYVAAVKHPNQQLASGQLNNYGAGSLIHCIGIPGQACNHHAAMKQHVLVITSDQ